MWQPKEMCRCGHTKDQHTSRDISGVNSACSACSGCDYHWPAVEDTRDGEWVTCPYCGYKHGDAWEWCNEENPQDTECSGCGKTFRCWAEYAVDYCGGPAINEDGSDKNPPAPIPTKTTEGE